MTDNLNFLRGSGTLATLMRAHDWSRSPLGAPAAWPQSLQTAVSMVLNSTTPKFIVWGDALAMLYNDAYLDVLGIKHPAALGHPVAQVWHELYDDVAPLLARTLAGEPLYFESMEFTLLRKGVHETAWISFSYTPLFSGDTIAGVYCELTETTDQILAERHRLDETRRLQQLFEQSPGMIAVVRGPNHVFESANSNYARFVGNRPLLGLSARDTLTELHSQGFLELLDHVYQTGQPYKARASRIRVNQGTPGVLVERFVDFVYQPIRDEHGVISGIFAEGLDVTEAVAASEALLKTREWLADGLQAGRMVVWEWDLNSDEVKYSDNAPEVLGLPGVKASSGLQTVHPDDQARMAGAVRNAIRGDDKFSEVSRRIRPDNGATIWVESTGRVLRNAQGEAISLRGIMIDLTERMHIEQELKESNRRKDDFLAMLAHELRNPLAPISTAAQLLRVAGADERRVRQSSEVIIRQVRHMTALVDDLLDVSRVTRGLVELDRTRVDLNVVANAAIEQVQPLIDARHHVLRVRLAAEPVLVEGDKTRLVQVLSNLLNNAAKYTPQEGRIVLAVRSEGGEAVITVQDNGSGIEATLLPRIFELFSQAERTPDRAQGGLGLGLALVNSIVTLHGGAVDADSAGVGQGSTFTVRLPLLQRLEAPADSAGTGDLPSAGAGRALRVMVVDDNVDAADSLAVLLGVAGHQVDVHAHPLSALEAARLFWPDVFILDIGLPGMDGYELARRLRALADGRTACFIALTGYGQSHDRVLARAAGFDEHFVKPLDPARLDSVLARLG